MLTEQSHTVYIQAALRSTALQIAQLASDLASTRGDAAVLEAQLKAACEAKDAAEANLRALTEDVQKLRAEMAEQARVK